MTVWLTRIKRFTAAIVVVNYVLCFQVYPTTIRALSLGICNAMSRLGAIITPFISQVNMFVAQRRWLCDGVGTESSTVQWIYTCTCYTCARCSVVRVWDCQVLLSLRSESNWNAVTSVALSDIVTWIRTLSRDFCCHGELAWSAGTVQSPSLTDRRVSERVLRLWWPRERFQTTTSWSCPTEMSIWRRRAWWAKVSFSSLVTWPNRLNCVFGRLGA